MRRRCGGCGDTQQTEQCDQQQQLKLILHKSSKTKNYLFCNHVGSHVLLVPGANVPRTYRLRCVKHFENVDLVPFELVRSWHSIETHQLFDRSHLGVALHPGHSQDAISRHVKSKKVLRRNRAVVNHFIPRSSVSDIDEPRVELPGPEEWHTLEGHIAAHHVARCCA